MNDNGLRIVMYTRLHMIIIIDSGRSIEMQLEQNRIECELQMLENNWVTRQMIVWISA